MSYRYKKTRAKRRFEESVYFDELEPLRQEREKNDT